MVCMCDNLPMRPTSVVMLQCSTARVLIDGQDIEGLTLQLWTWLQGLHRACLLQWSALEVQCLDRQRQRRA